MIRQTDPTLTATHAQMELNHTDSEGRVTPVQEARQTQINQEAIMNLILDSVLRSPQDLRKFFKSHCLASQPRKYFP